MAIAIATAPVAAQAAANEEDILREFALRNSVPGMSVTWFEADEKMHSRFIGMSDLENSIPVTAATVFHVASVSKPLTAILAMLSVRDGCLQLDAPFSDYLPEHADELQGITLRRLLSHRSGLAHWQAQELIAPKAVADLQEAVTMALKRPRTCAPGSCTSYSTPAFNLIGLALQRCHDAGFADIAAHTWPAVDIAMADPYRLLSHRAHGYRLHPNGYLINAALLDITDRAPGGGFALTSEALATILGQLMAGDTLSPTELDTLWRISDASESNGCALGWRVRTSDGRTVVYHGGSQPGFSAMVMLEPAQRRGIVLLANRGGLRLTALAEKLLEPPQGFAGPK